MLFVALGFWPHWMEDVQWAVGQSRMLKVEADLLQRHLKGAAERIALLKRVGVDPARVNLCART